jgi:hypothetical protein
VGDLPRLIVNRQALEADPARDTGLFHERYLTGLWSTSLQDLLTIPVKRVRIRRGNESDEWLSYQLVPGDPQQRPGPQIGLHDLALHIQREIARRGKVVEIHITIAGRFEFHLGPAEFVVLHF